MVGKGAAPYMHARLVTTEQVTTQKTHEQPLEEIKALMDLPPTLRNG